MDLLLEGHGLEDLVDGVFPELGNAFAAGEGQDCGADEHDFLHIVSIGFSVFYVRQRYVESGNPFLFGCSIIISDVCIW